MKKNFIRKAIILFDFGFMAFFSIYLESIMPAAGHTSYAAILSAALAAAASIGSAIYGGVTSAAAAKKQQQMIQQLKAQNTAWYNRKMNEDYLDTAAGQNTMRRVQDVAKQNLERSRGEAAVTGDLTNSAATKEQNNKMISDTVGNIAAMDANRKDSYDASYRQTDQAYSQMQLGAQQAKADGAAQAAAGVSNSLMNIAAQQLGNYNKANTPSVSGQQPQVQITTPQPKSATIGVDNVSELQKDKDKFGDVTGAYRPNYV